MPPPIVRADEYLTASALSLRVGVPEHVIRRAAARGLLPQARAGRFGLYAVADLPRIAEALKDAGLMPAASVPALADPASLPAHGGLMM